MGEEPLSFRPSLSPSLLFPLDSGREMGPQEQ